MGGVDLAARSFVLFAAVFVVQQLREGAVDSSAETPFLISVNGFEDEQEGADFEYDSAYKGGDTAAVQDLVGELTSGADEREPREETVEDPEDRTRGENHGDQVRVVPVGEIGAHADDALEGSSEGGGSSRSSNVGFGRGIDNEGVPAFSIVPRAPFVFQIGCAWWRSGRGNILMVFILVRWAAGLAVAITFQLSLADSGV